MSALQESSITPEQYLEIEFLADHKSEYFAGQMYAMAGALPAHVLLVTNLVAELGVQLRRRPCGVYSTDLKVHVSETGLFTYPDVIVVCGELELLGKRKDILLNPTVIIEVLSDSTELYDRTSKFEHYRRLKSLQIYLLVSQKAMRIELYERQANDRWLLTVSEGEAGMLEITSIGCTLANADIYSKVALEPGNILEITRGGLTEAAN